MRYTVCEKEGRKATVQTAHTRKAAQDAGNSCYLWARELGGWACV